MAQPAGGSGKSLQPELAASADDAELKKLLAEWHTMSSEMNQLNELQANYVQKLNALHKIEAQCLKGVSGENRQLKQLKGSLARLKNRARNLNETDNERLKDVLKAIAERQIALDDMSEHLPRENNGLYLNIILGSINLSLMNKKDKFRYKDEYEMFKFNVTSVALVVATLCLLLHSRWMDSIYFFLLVWYYCTLTIRESILRVNGSQCVLLSIIKGWWVLHHYISTALCGVAVTWPDGVCYQQYRLQYIIFSMYLGVVQLLQCQYQRGCLYRLRALGMGHSMDVTVEGFHSWMWRGLTFLLPLLFFGYFWQLYNSYVLFQLWYAYKCSEWQVMALCVLFLVIFVGNTSTTSRVVWQKMFGATATSAESEQRLTNKYAPSSVALDRLGGDGAQKKSE